MNKCFNCRKPIPKDKFLCDECKNKEIEMSFGWTGNNVEGKSKVRYGNTTTKISSKENH